MTCWALRLARGLLPLLSECWEVSASSLEFQTQGGKCFLQICSLDLKLCSEVCFCFKIAFGFGLFWPCCLLTSVKQLSVPQVVVFVRTFEEFVFIFP